MVRFLAAFLAALLTIAIGNVVWPASPSLKGQLLVAAPELADMNFARTVVFMIDHDSTGAFGLVVNRRLGAGPLDKLLEGFGLPSEGAEGEIALYAGGPVKNQVGFILHTPDYRDETTRDLAPGTRLSSDVRILESIAREHKPRRFLFAFGYSGWGPGQLERERARNDWIVVPLNPDLVFEGDGEKTWERARKAAGITL